MQPVGRCPRCGYVLRYDEYGFRCDFCGFKHRQRSLTERVQDFERALSLGFQNLLDIVIGPRSPQAVTYNPVWIPQHHPCISCGLNLQASTQRCPRCGAVQIAIPTSPAISEGTQTPDGRVLDYIVAHEGTISLSQAARDLSISLGDLRSTIERLKSAGFLNQA